MVDVCIVPLIPTTRMIGSSTSHPIWDKRGWRIAYLSTFLVVAATGNLSLQYVNSNICTLRFVPGLRVVWLWGVLLGCIVCLV